MVVTQFKTTWIFFYLNYNKDGNLSESFDYIKKQNLFLSAVEVLLIIRYHCDISNNGFIMQPDVF